MPKPIATMQRVTVFPDGVAVVEADRPVPGSGEILVESRVVGVCGSDTHAAAGHHPHMGTVRGNLAAR